MRRGWRPILAGGAVVACTFALAQAEIFAPSAPAGATASGGDIDRGETVFVRECAGCHGSGGSGGEVGPRLVGTGIEAATATAVVRQGRGVMPAGLVSGSDEADVVAYVVSVSSP
ncbi:MAG TPA: cytochrome c [Gaiellaceae bacterium]|nr:cytochrome c [Gaiellaceae bacterium]